MNTLSGTFAQKVLEHRGTYTRTHAHNHWKICLFRLMSRNREHNQDTYRVRTTNANANANTNAETQLPDVAHCSTERTNAVCVCVVGVC